MRLVRLTFARLINQIHNQKTQRHPAKVSKAFKMGSTPGWFNSQSSSGHVKQAAAQSQINRYFSLTPNQS